MSQPTGAPPADTAQAARTPEQIEAEIARTRESLADEIDVLQDRLSPASLAGAARDLVLRPLRRPDGSFDPVRTAAAATVAVILLAYLVRRRGL